jgi:hypothetical protein
MTTTVLLISAITNVAVTVHLLQTRRRLNKVQRMFKMYVRTHQSPRRTVIARHSAPWEIR